MAEIVRSKKLRGSEVKGRLTIPRSWWILINNPNFSDRHCHRGHEKEVWVVDGATGMFWEFQCAVRQSGPYRKPVLQSKGWLKFVNHKGLRAGDKIVLEPACHEFRGTRFVLRAQRLTVDGRSWLDV